MIGTNEGVRRDDKQRRYVHGTEEKAKDAVVVEPRRSPRRGIRTRMTGKQVSRVERKRKLSYRRPNGGINEKTTGEEKGLRVNVVVDVDETTEQG